MILETIIISTVLGTGGIIGSYYLYKKKREIDGFKQVALFYDNESIQDAIEYVSEED